MTKVSIITPSFNSSCFLRDSIESVLAQTFKEWELIIVDDCSTDDSVEIALGYAERDPRINVISTPSNSGAGIARNIAIRRARGRFIAFLDSDDMWQPAKLEKQLGFMEANNFSFTFTAYEQIDESGRVIRRVKAPRRVSYYDLLKSCSIGCLTVIYDTQSLGKVEMPLIRKRQDLGLWLRLLKSTKYSYGLNEAVAYYRVRKGSISSNKFNAARYQWRLYYEVESLGLISSLYFFLHYAIRGFAKTKLGPLMRGLLGS